MRHIEEIPKIDDFSSQPTAEKIIAKQICETVKCAIEKALLFALRTARPFLSECRIAPPINSQQIINMQSTMVKMLHDPSPSLPIPPENPLLLAIYSNMDANFQLWHLEDEARRTDVPDVQIAALKRKIDAENQRRNNQIEEIDDTLQKQLPSVTSSVPFNSETPGSIIDRLSITCLKIYHMGIEVQRSGSTEEHRHACKQKLQTLICQRNNLALALDELLLDLSMRRKRLVLYRPFKMYNDPNLNPALYRKP